MQEKVKLFSGLGMRVISFAFRRIEKFDLEAKRESIESEMVYLGFVGIIDPARDGVSESVAELKGAGITSVMITGDAAATAESIAREVGIMEEDDLVVEGSALQELSNEDFQRASVFARIRQKTKWR